MGNLRAQLTARATPAPAPPPPFDADTWQGVIRELQLPPQQARLVASLLRGRKDKEIAAELGLSVPTVRTYLNRIFARVGVRDRLELVVRVFVVARAVESQTVRHQP